MADPKSWLPSEALPAFFVVTGVFSTGAAGGAYATHLHYVPIIKNSELQISSLNKEIAGLNKEISGLNEQISGLKADIPAIQERLKVLEMRAKL